MFNERVLTISYDRIEFNVKFVLHHHIITLDFQSHFAAAAQFTTACIT